MDFEEACTFARRWRARIDRTARLPLPPPPSGDATSTGPLPGHAEARTSGGSTSRKSDS